MTVYMIEKKKTGWEVYKKIEGKERADFLKRYKEKHKTK